MEIAVIGSGVSGLAAAYLLAPHHQVTVFEANDRLGGHTHTVTIPEGKDHGLCIDTGFIVFNETNYPNFIQFLNRLNVPYEDTNMSFGFYDEHKHFYYSSEALFAQKKNLTSLSFLTMIKDIVKLKKKALNALAGDVSPNQTLREFLKEEKFSQTFIDQYLIPMGAAIWSSSAKQTLDFPSKSFLSFWDNHQLFNIHGRPQWKTVTNGSHNYIKAIQKKTRAIFKTGTPITAIKRTQKHVTLTDGNGKDHKVDAVIIATHADQALKLLKDPTDTENELLKPWVYSNNETILHTDKSLLPPQKEAWASWNYAKPKGKSAGNPTSVTYYMNKLQNLNSTTNYFVTLNPTKPIAEDQIIKKMTYQHPIYTTRSLKSQEKLHTLNGYKNTYYCGSYFGYGFHEDAITSAIKVATELGAKWE